MKRFALLGAVVAISLSGSQLAHAEPNHSHGKHVNVNRMADGKSIEGEYVVALQDGASIDEVLGDLKIDKPIARYTHALNGFAAKLSSQQLLTLQSDDRVSLIDENGVGDTSSESECSLPLSTTTCKGLTEAGRAFYQAHPEWFLDRISQQQPLPTDPAAYVSSFNPASTGAGVNAYVLDNGIDLTHPEFGGRATNDHDVFPGGNGGLCPSSADSWDHGTEVAGMLGGSATGIARQVKLHSVKISQCTTATIVYSNMLLGVDWLLTGNNMQKPAVVNISYEYPRIADLRSTLTGAVDKLSAAGAFIATAAGNDANNPGTPWYACLSIPQNAKGGITVASSTRLDTIAVDSNSGGCVGMYAPGLNVTTTAPNNTHMFVGGTSFAAPLVAGAAALYKATYGDAPTATIQQWLISHATSGAITDNPPPSSNFGTTPNLLLNISGL